MSNFGKLSLTANHDRQTDMTEISVWHPGQFIFVCTEMYVNENCKTVVVLMLELGDARTRRTNYSMRAIYF